MQHLVWLLQAPPGGVQQVVPSHLPLQHSRSSQQALRSFLHCDLSGQHFIAPLTRQHLVPAGQMPPPLQHSSPCFAHPPPTQQVVPAGQQPRPSLQQKVPGLQQRYSPLTWQQPSPERQYWLPGPQQLPPGGAQQLPRHTSPGLQQYRPLQQVVPDWQQPFPQQLVPAGQQPLPQQMAPLLQQPLPQDTP